MLLRDIILNNEDQSKYVDDNRVRIRRISCFDGSQYANRTIAFCSSAVSIYWFFWFLHIYFFAGSLFTKTASRQFALRQH